MAKEAKRGASAKPEARPKSEARAKSDVDGKGGGRRARLLALSGIVERLGGARLCYGEPIRDGVRTIVPVARVRARGGGGWGSDAESGGGGGGGGALDARPVGFIEVGPDGTRFEPIHDPEAFTRTLKAGTTAVLTLATAFAGLRAARHGRRLLGSGGASRGRRLLGRGD